MKRVVGNYQQVGKKLCSIANNEIGGNEQQALKRVIINSEYQEWLLTVVDEKNCNQQQAIKKMGY